MWLKWSLGKENYQSNLQINLQYQVLKLVSDIAKKSCLSGWNNAQSHKKTWNHALWDSCLHLIFNAIVRKQGKEKLKGDKSISTWSKAFVL